MSSPKSSKITTKSVNGSKMDSFPENDVVIGRTFELNNHTGTKVYHEKVGDNLIKYIQASTNREKENIAQTIFRELKQEGRCFWKFKPKSLIVDEKKIIETIKQSIRDLKIKRLKASSRGDNPPTVNVTRNCDFSTETGNTTYNPTRTLHPRSVHLIHQRIEPHSQFRHDACIPNIFNYEKTVGNTTAASSPQYNYIIVEQSQSILTLTHKNDNVGTSPFTALHKDLKLQNDCSFGGCTKRDMYQSSVSDFFELFLERTKPEFGIELNESILSERFNSSWSDSLSFSSIGDGNKSSKSSFWCNIEEVENYGKMIMRECSATNSFNVSMLEDLIDIQSTNDHKSISYESVPSTDNNDCHSPRSDYQCHEFFTSSNMIQGPPPDTDAVQSVQSQSNTSPTTPRFSNVSKRIPDLGVMKRELPLFVPLRANLGEEDIDCNLTSLTPSEHDIIQLDCGIGSSSSKLESSMMSGLYASSMCSKTADFSTQYMNSIDIQSEPIQLTSLEDDSESKEFDDSIVFSSDNSALSSKSLWSNVKDAEHNGKTITNESDVTDSVNRLVMEHSIDIQSTNDYSLMSFESHDLKDSNDCHNQRSVCQTKEHFTNDDTRQGRSSDTDVAQPETSQSNTSPITPRFSNRSKLIPDRVFMYLPPLLDIPSGENFAEEERYRNHTSLTRSEHDTCTDYSLSVLSVDVTKSDSTECRRTVLIISKQNDNKERNEHSSSFYSDIGASRNSIEIDNSSMSIKTIDVGSIQNMSGLPFLDGDSKSSEFDDSIVLSLDNSAIRSKTREPTEQYCDTTNFIQHNNMSDSLHLSSLKIYFKR